MILTMYLFNIPVLSGKICKIIAHQFLRQEKALRVRNMPKFRF